MRHFITPHSAITHSIKMLKDYGMDVDPGHWQGVSTEGRPDLMTRELLNMAFSCGIPHTIEDAAVSCEPNLPWAEAHFRERVSRVPSNPGVEYQNWPWWRGQVSATTIAGHEAHSPGMDSLQEPTFTHTYQERFWPKRANGVGRDNWRPLEDKFGIRYHYGDLDDVVELVRRHPNTRQATLPIFFPEDTGARHGGRVPCTLHYHFLLRHGRLNLWYPIRSCDAVRHFRDDLYMAVRLCQWVIEELRNGDNDYPEQALWEDTIPGNLYFSAYSFHVHKGDEHRL
jgi:hypothetical protein